ncbi:MAG: hypothetical protein WCK65_15680, partial [Rhodospirillaceae bacterium]
PGLSLLALPVVYLVREAMLISGHDPASISPGGLTPAFKLYAYAATLGTVGVLTALTAVMVLRVALALGIALDGALFGAVAFGLGTPAFGWATAFFGHAATGGLLFLAFGTAIPLATGEVDLKPFTRRLFIVGFLLGLAVSVEIFSAVAVTAIGLFALGLAAIRLPRMGAMVAGSALALGGLIGLASLPIYDFLAFGSPFITGYTNVVGFPGMKVGFFGISDPDPGVIGALLFGAYRGLLPLAPVLMLLPFGLCVMARERHLRGAALVILLVCLSYLAINGGYYYWDGRASTGPRYLVPTLPFAGLALAFAWSIGRFKLIYLALLIVSILISVICVSVDMFCPTSIAFPLGDYLIPAFLAGHIRSVTTVFGVGGLVSLIPLMLFWVLIGERVFSAARSVKLASCIQLLEINS